MASTELQREMRDQILAVLREADFAPAAFDSAFRKAFADMAHQQQIFHGNPATRETYNFLFRTVRILVLDAHNIVRRRIAREKQRPRLDAVRNITDQLIFSLN